MKDEDDNLEQEVMINNETYVKFKIEKEYFDDPPVEDDYFSSLLISVFPRSNNGTSTSIRLNTVNKEDILALSKAFKELSKEF